MLLEMQKNTGAAGMDLRAVPKSKLGANAGVQLVTSKIASRMPAKRWWKNTLSIHHLIDTRYGGFVVSGDAVDGCPKKMCTHTCTQQKSEVAETSQPCGLEAPTM